MAWLALGTALTALTAVQVTLLGYRAATAPGLALGGVALLLAFAVTVLWLLAIAWLVLGSWRRTVWGCPFDHEASAPPARRCPRHPLLSEPIADEPGRGAGPEG